MIAKLLWGSGVLAFIAIAVRSSVLVGLYLGVIPGIVLALAPTVFLYAAAFALLRRLLPLAPGAMANAAAAVATVGLGFALAAPFALSGKLAFAAADTGDVVPGTPVPIAGAVRLERDAKMLRDGLPKAGTWECDALCAALLDMPQVRSVTLAGTDAAGVPFKPATFRLVPKAEASSAGVAPRDPEKIFEYLPEQARESGNWEARRAARDAKRNALIAKWALRLATEKTLIAEPAAGDADLTIAIGDAQETGLHRISVAKVEIRNNSGQVLMRRQRVSASPVAMPLYTVPQGPMLDGGFGIGRSLLHTGPRFFTFKPVEVLLAETGLTEPQVAESGVADMRERLAAALGRPGRSGDLDLAAAWIATLDWRKLERPDIDLLARAIRDPRVTGLDRIYDGYEKEVSPRLRDSLIVRLLDPATTPQLRSRFNRLVRAMPPGTFAVPTPDERALLGNQQLRLVSDALVERLADGGADATPLLSDILQADARVEPWAKRQWVMAAICRAFTRLGPDASAALPVVERLFAQPRSPLMNIWGEAQDWRVAMVRMGKPVETLAFPPQFSAESVEQNREDVRRMTARAEARNK